ncbi:MAG: hypothetical protein JXB00_02685 [Bacteroidales bacterium]|nr:hypothetical protein [Bacteroidales bacterium]
MAQEGQDNNFNTIEIPKVFRTFISEEHFTNCIVCDRYLLDGSTDYVIEKAFKDGYVEIEYAMCMECLMKMREHMSQESLERIGKYFEENFDFMSKRFPLIATGNNNVEDYISKCIFKDKTIEESGEYQIMGQFRGTKMVFSAFPYMVCKDVIEEVQELLSAKTKEELDDFTNRYFGLPPDLKEILRTKKPVIF